MTPRAAFLRALPGCGFAPPEADVAALGGDLPAGAAADRFAADVRGFAAEFWELAPVDRRARWELLSARAAGPAAAWLAEFEPGLAVTPVPQPDEYAADIARVVRDGFVLPPAARAALRLAWLAAPARRGVGWGAASRTVLRTDTPLARLDAPLFAWFSLGERPEAVAQRVGRKRRPQRDPEPEPAGGCVDAGWKAAAVLFFVLWIAKLIYAVVGPSRW